MNLLKLSKLELRLLEVLCMGEQSSGELARRLGLKESSVSRAVGSLRKKALVSVEKKGGVKALGLSLASHAQALRELFQARPAVGLEWLAGKALDVLVVMEVDKGAGVKLLESECDCSKATLFKVLKQLRYATIVAKNDESYQITYPPARKLAKEFADNLQRLEQNSFRQGEYSVGIRVRKHVVMRSGFTPSHAPQGEMEKQSFAITGMNALVKAGLQVVPTSYGDAYFNLDGKLREISIEEAFIHAVLFSTLPQHAGDKTALALFLKTGPQMNFKKLKELAKTYCVESALQELRDAVGYYEKLRDYE